MQENQKEEQELLRRKAQAKAQTKGCLKAFIWCIISILVLAAIVFFLLVASCEHMENSWCHAWYGDRAGAMGDCD